MTDNQTPPPGNVFKDGLGLLIQNARDAGVPNADLKTILQNAADKIPATPTDESTPAAPAPEAPTESDEPKLRPVNS